VSVIPFRERLVCPLEFRSTCADGSVEGASLRPRTDLNVPARYSRTIAGQLLLLRRAILYGTS